MTGKFLVNSFLYCFTRVTRNNPIFSFIELHTKQEVHAILVT